MSRTLPGRAYRSPTVLYSRWPRQGGSWPRTHTKRSPHAGAMAGAKFRQRDVIGAS